MAKKTTQSKPKKDSSVQTALRELKRQTGAAWTYNPKTRGFTSSNFDGTATGIRQKDGLATISRRQFDKNYGLLKRQGFTGYEQKALSRKTSALTGFKAPSKAVNYPQRTFKSREEMFKFLRSYKGDRQFRVILQGQPIDNRYQQDKNGFVFIYGDQLAAMNAEDLLEDYDGSELNPGGVEAKLKNVKTWTLVAFRQKL